MRLRPLSRPLTVLLLTCTSALLLAAHAPQPPAPAAQQRHPLDPLTDVEINAAARVLRASPQFPAGALFATIVLKEPPKSDVLSHSPDGIVNPTAQNALGHHTSYILIPAVNSMPYVATTSQVRRRAAFINQHFWATRYHPDELYAAGAYPNQSLGDAGLPAWVANNESLSNQDVVVWYTMGVTHIPRPEEWPVMSVTHVGFKMIPGGFFSRNPALDVPR